MKRSWSRCLPEARDSMTISMGHSPFNSVDVSLHSLSRSRYRQFREVFVKDVDAAASR